MSSSPWPLSPEGAVPDHIGRYEILDLVGRGGMGALYRARDPILDRDVALKIMLTLTTEDAATRARFAREAKTVAHLQHRNVVTIYEYGESSGVPYIVMEFLAGQDLEKLLRGSRVLRLDEKLAIAIQLCEGLGYAHERGIVHRDIKPGNVRVLEDGTVKILDFGIARFSIDALTQSSTVLGTPSYMAPEQITGKVVDGRTDLFSTGILLYEMLTGKLPFEGRSAMEVAYQVVHAEPEPLAGVVADLPEGLADVVTRALQKNPADRYARAGDLGAALQQVRRKILGISTDAVETVMVHTAPAGIAPPATDPAVVPPPARSGVLWKAAAAVLVLLLSGVGGVFLWQQFHTAPPTSDSLAGVSTPAPAPVLPPAVDPPAPAAPENIVTAMMSKLVLASKAMATRSYNDVIRQCTEIIDALRASGQSGNAAMLAQAFEMRARARLATGDRAGAEQDFRSVLKLDSTWALDAGTPIAATSMFENIRAQLTAPKAPPPPSASIAIASAAGPAGLAPGAGSVNVGAPPPPPPPSQNLRNVGSSGAGDLSQGGGPVVSAGKPPPPPPPIPVGGQIKDPVRKKYVDPVYPPAAKARGIVGTVVLRVTIDEVGNVVNPQILQSVSTALDDAARNAVLQWKYEPTTLNGKPQPIYLVVNVNFLK